MAVGDLITQDGQLELPGPLLIGRGTSYGISKIEGLDMPDVRTTDWDRPNDHGEYAGTDRYKGRTIRATVDIEGQPGADIASKVQALQTALVVQVGTTITVAMQPAGMGKRVAFVRPRRFGWVGDPDLYMLAAPTVLFELHSFDPRLYDQVLQTPSGGLPISAGGGLTFNATPNFTFSGVTGSTGIFNVTNAGNFASRPVATINGPVQDPRLENTTTGQFIRLSGLTLGSTDILTIDFDAKTILLNGTTSQYGFLASDSTWWELVPGVNQIRFTAAAYQAAALLTLSFRSAWV